MPHPRRPLRDALGLLRLLYVAEDRLADDQARATLSALRHAGNAIARALTNPSPVTHAGAVVALEALGALPWSPERRELLVLATDRVRGRPRELVAPEDRRKLARIGRG